MTTINLREFFYWYRCDEFIEVSDEVARELRADKAYEINHWRRMKRNKANYFHAGHRHLSERTRHTKPVCV